MLDITKKEIENRDIDVDLKNELLNRYEEVLQSGGNGNLTEEEMVGAFPIIN
jgi:hypothetical protein